MVFKINLSEKSGKTFKIESESEQLVGKSLHDKIEGNEISPELNGYEFEIAGASDSAGFPSRENVEGVGLKKVLLRFGKDMKKRPKKEGKRKRSKNRPKGLRLRKTVRGQTISPAMIQINLKTIKEGSKKLSEIFPEQNKAKEEPKPTVPNASSQ
ncbi:MAG: S6e family ribosomal protein [Candidatus Nanoarchaeia archaeon]